MAESHAAQDVVGFRELDVGIGRDLDAIAPGVEEVEKRLSSRGTPIASSVRRTSGLSSTAMPKWRIVSGRRSGLRMKLMNWSPK
jgi:hypothetical protein